MCYHRREKEIEHDLDDNEEEVHNRVILGVLLPAATSYS